MIYTHSLCWWYHLPHNPTYPCLLYSPVCIICLCTAWKLVTQLVLWTESTSKDYIRAEHKLQSISKLFIPQVIIPNTKTTAQIVFTISKRKTRKTTTRVLEPICIPRALNTGTCIQQGDLFFFLWDYTRTMCENQLISSLRFAEHLKQCCTQKDCYGHLQMKKTGREIPQAVSRALFRWTDMRRTGWFPCPFRNHIWHSQKEGAG